MAGDAGRTGHRWPRRPTVDTGRDQYGAWADQFYPDGVGAWRPVAAQVGALGRAFGEVEDGRDGRQGRRTRCATWPWREPAARADSAVRQTAQGHQLIGW